MSKVFKRYAMILALFMLAAVFVACTKKDDGGDSVDRQVEFVTTTQSLSVNAEYQLEPKLNSYDSKLQWEYETDDDSIAIVSDNGLIEALEVGSTLITASTKIDEATFSGEIEIVVTEITEDTPIIVVSDQTGLRRISVGSSAEMRANQENGNALGTIQWSSTDSSVATVDSQGRVTGLKQGQTKIYARTIIEDIQYKGFADIIVSPLGQEIFVVAERELILERDTTTVSATINPQDAIPDVTWTSSQGGVATVDSDGIVTGVADGTTSVVATSVGTPDLAGSVDITVLSIVKITTPDKVLVVDANNTQTMQAVQRTGIEDEQINKNATFKWAIDSGSEYAWIDADSGMITATNAGQVVVRATLVDSNFVVAPFNTTIVTVVETPSANEFVQANSNLLDIEKQYIESNKDKGNITSDESDALTQVVEAYMQAKVLMRDEPNAQYNTEFLNLTAHIQELFDEFSTEFKQFVDENAFAIHDAERDYYLLKEDTQNTLNLALEGEKPSLEDIDALQERLDIVELDIVAVIDNLDNILEDGNLLHFEDIILGSNLDKSEQFQSNVRIIIQPIIELLRTLAD